MKLLFAFFLSALTSVSALKPIEMADVKADSPMGMQLLSQARRLEQDEDQDEVTWVSGFSLKFQGCHHLYQWNDEVDEEEDVRLYSKRLARFRLCPSDSCSASDAGGCDSGYGDYVVDMHTYINAAYEAKMQFAEDQCQEYIENYCSCEGNGDDNWNEAACQLDCVQEAGMEVCYDYLADEMYEGFQVQDYLYCGGYNGANRRLGDGDDEAAAELFVGPYCSTQGGSIFLGMFSDDSCTTFIDENSGASSFEQMTGFELPYSQKSLVDDSCLSCLTENDNDDNYNVEVAEACETVYRASGRCEGNLPSGTTYNLDTSACNYIEGIKIVREDGIVQTLASRPNAVATAFVVIFAMAFFAMLFYVWYLRTRLGIKGDTLL